MTQSGPVLADCCNQLHSTQASKNAPKYESEHGKYDHQNYHRGNSCDCRFDHENHHRTERHLDIDYRNFAVIFHTLPLKCLIWSYVFY